MNTCPPSSVLSNSTSWSGPIGLNAELEQNLGYQTQPSQPSLHPHPHHLQQEYPEQARQTRRSWARSKRISLGCLEWRTNPTVIRRSPRPKSASHRLDIPSIGEPTGQTRGDQSDSNSTVSCTECGVNNGLATEVIKPDTTNRCSQRTRVRVGGSGGGADGLLRRLRMRPLSKNSRAKTPTPVGSEIAGRLASIPVRSSSTPRTSCMSKSFVEWTAPESNIFPNCSHGSRLNVTTAEESRFSPISTPQRTESYPMVGLCSKSTQCPCTNQAPAPMTRSFIPCTSSYSLGSTNNHMRQESDPSQNSSHLPSAVCPMCTCTADCCQPSRSTNNTYTAVPNELYRPQSQPTCYFFSHGTPSMPDLEATEIRRPMTHYSTLPWPTTNPSPIDKYTRPVPPENNVSSIPDPNRTTNFWSANSPQPTFRSSCYMPTPMLASYPSVPRHGQFAFPSSRTAEALFVNCADSTVNQTQWPNIPAHVTVSSTVLHPDPPVFHQNIYQSGLPMHSPRALSIEKPCDDTLYRSSLPPPLSVATATQLHPYHLNKQNFQLHTTNTTVHSNQTRPDSLLSTSSLTTADSSQTDSMPNSSSSRDSALGGNLQQADMGGLSQAKLTELNVINTVQTRHSAHQSHPNHLHHHYHHHNNNDNNNSNNHNDSQPQPPLPAADHRVWHAEESHQPNSRSQSTPSSADPTRFGPAPTPTSPPPHPPPKPATAIESKMATTPTRSVAWPPRLTPLPDFTASQPYWPSQKARAERKHSVYVNAAIYPLREQPQTPNGLGDRTQSGGGNTCRTPPTSWTHLLPYRTSTVPQNLSERLKKSETLPNDVWIHTQRQNLSNEPHLQTTIPSAPANDTGMDQSNRPNGSAGIPSGLKSPPPRPPVRTSSQQLTGRGPSAVETRAPRPVPTVDPVSKTSLSTLSPTQARQSADPQLSGLLSSEKSTLDDSPILCRYSQLYSLSLKPEPSERARFQCKPSANHSDSPVLSRPNMTTRVESQMHKLRIRTEDLG